jgi:hypothetical protein
MQGGTLPWSIVGTGSAIRKQWKKRRRSAGAAGETSQLPQECLPTQHPLGELIMRSQDIR